MVLTTLLALAPALGADLQATVQVGRTTWTVTIQSGSAGGAILVSSPNHNATPRVVESIEHDFLKPRGIKTWKTSSGETEAQVLYSTSDWNHAIFLRLNERRATEALGLSFRHRDGLVLQLDKSGRLAAIVNTLNSNDKHHGMLLGDRWWAVRNVYIPEQKGAWRLASSKWVVVPHGP